MRADRRRILIAAGALMAAGLATAAVVLVRIRTAVREALVSPSASRRPLQFAALPVPSTPLEHWGGGEVEALVLTPTTLWTAGGSGVSDGERRYDTASGLPTLQASALALWRGQMVAALAAGGLFRLVHGRWEEARSGFGTLHVRTLVETPAGELLIGAREGLFRAAWGGTALEQLDTRPVRSIAVGGAFVLAGGEEGLNRVAPGRATRVETPDPWVESVSLAGEELFVVTAAGLARGRVDGPVVPIAGGEEIVSGLLHEGSFYGLPGEVARVLRRFERLGRAKEESLPSPTRRLMASNGVLFADTEEGLYRRTPAGWRLARPRPPSLPPGSSHIGALAWLGPRLVAGFFDGGLAVAEPREGSLEWRTVPGSSAWGVNALLSAGGVVYVASLRGAARFDGERLTGFEGPGAAFSLAATADGVAIGYGQGVLLPGSRLLSAFHGLPGNQALALASGPSLFVGTPSGLGALSGRRVRWRVTQGEGQLPHAWVTSLALDGETLFVGTYGGGVVRRASSAAAAPESWSDAGRFEPFPETEGLKINPGCLVETGGRIYLGTDGHGLYRLSRDGRRFVPMRLPLPSPRVTTLLPGAGALLIGTDEGLARLPLTVEETQASGGTER